MTTPQLQQEASPPPTWAIMPVLAHPEYTRAAIADVLAQTVSVRLLLINQGVDDGFRGELERIAEADERIFVWSHQPPLPSLAATWNRALDFVWAVGVEEALVVNNDVRLRRDTIAELHKVRVLTDALFVSCVGVTPEQFNPDEGLILCDDPDADHPKLAKGGPDFSCYLIAKAMHDQFRFDEAFSPAFCEDLDMHRRLLLAGLGDRIFSINLPYLHYGSATIKTVGEKQRSEITRAIEAGSRAHYARKWGGPVNQETFYAPFDQGVEGSSTAGMPNPPTTPALHAWDRTRTRPEGLGTIDRYYSALAPDQAEG